MRYRLQSDSGHFAEFVVSGDRLVEMQVEWPDDQDELVFIDPPTHTTIDDVPEHIRAHAEARDEVVCLYDPRGCRTCFCDGKGRMRCVGMC
jgi:hypothetical protein